MTFSFFDDISRYLTLIIVIKAPFMLIADNLSCTRSETLLFQGLGFCLQEGSLLLLKGANGCGKTSLLKMLCGLLPVYSGHVVWNGENTLNNPQFKRDLMMIGHKSAVKQDATVEENIRFWAHYYDTQTLVAAALQFYGLTRFKDVPARELSAGWQRKVALARLIVAPCKLWLLDEPTNFLDEEAVLLTASLIETRVKQGGVVVVASHIINSGVASHTLSLEDFA